ncbi:CII family transcriptional regulator [Pseudomonas gingeri]|uniref:CII family transcriptional regulator n=1 Tax=Pseudomonas gingeri TaxID=117681 RepID=UPI0015A389B1|nr:CII family transcriptional regulator [Pseudomonas gingeri]NWA03741.1 transcriptional regulator [Pseudomonas gingeri]NWA14600.1 transcriptional regulator [Pseudomonas gingeri]NWA54782.1 transcriptional regulator [Pseudomonas gingeri]NWA94506.1 transcriptional regulator [Pseudomonas gingeri]NWB01162.1 transcriptional regulator [Pseudomonas gingeri]
MPTSPLSQEQTVRARKNYSVLMQHLASVGNAPVALAVGCDEATISRMKPEKFEQFCQILAVLGLKIVPTNMRCFDVRDIEAILYQAKRWMEHIQGVDQLQED